MNQKHVQIFRATMVAKYADLFANDPEYAYSAAHCTPDQLADKMLPGLADGSASKDGKGIAHACKVAGIKHTYKAIREYLTAPEAQS